MSFYQRFDFFERSFGDEAMVETLKGMRISCSHFGKNCLWLGDFDGILYRFNRDMTSTMFLGYEKDVSIITQSKEKDILITSGTDSSVSDVIKIWNLSKWTKQKKPSILREINNGSYLDNEFKITALDVMPNLTSMVLGLGNGKIEWIHNNVMLAKRCKRNEVFNMQEKPTTLAISEDIQSNSVIIYLTSTTKTVVLHANLDDYKVQNTTSQFSANPVVNIISSHTMNIPSSLAGLTGKQVFPESNSNAVAKINLKSSLGSNEAGCPMKCSILLDNVFFVANNRGIYEISSEAVGCCHAIDGDKINLYAHKNYLIVVKLITPSILTGAHLQKKMTGQSAANSNATYQVVIFDRVNKYIAGDFPIVDFQFLFIEWGSIYIFCGYPTNKMIILTEKDIQIRMKMFFQKNSFNFAIETAKAQNFDENALADMFRQYGDHLFLQKNYSEAMENYIKTIGKLEPSFVIGKFLDTSHIHNLVKYMEALVQQTEYTGHLVLLINCYIILNDKEKLRHLIKNHNKIPFDLDNIMNLLRKVELFDEALNLAERYERYDWYFKVLVDDLKRYNDAIKYLAQMPLAETKEALLTYGNVLINIGPITIAEQLERVCSQQDDSKLSIATILNVFANNREGLKHFLYSYINKTQGTEDCYMIYVDTYLELKLYEYQKNKDKSDRISVEIMNILMNDKLEYNKSKAIISCKERGFHKGYRYLSQLKEKYLNIVESCREENDIECLLETCHQYGEKNPELWIKALEYLVEINADDQYFLQVIQAIEVNGLISPLLLLQKMTRGKNTLQFGLIKDYILRYYANNEKLINQYQHEIELLKEETKKNDDIIQCLNTEVQVFQNLKCVTCTNPLDIPSVHFLCGHSYHLRCFETYSNNKEECPDCSPDLHQLISEINQWQTVTDKVTSSLMSSADGNNSNLSLDKLWQLVLQQPIHPIQLDPNEFIASVASSVSSKQVQQKQLNNSQPLQKELQAAKSVDNDQKNPFNTLTNYPMQHVSSESNLRQPHKEAVKAAGSINRVSSGSNILSNPPFSASPVKVPPIVQLNPFDTPPAAIKATSRPSSTMVASNATQPINPFDTHPTGSTVSVSNSEPDNPFIVGSAQKTPFGNFNEPTANKNATSSSSSAINYDESKNPFI